MLLKTEKFLKVKNSVVDRMKKLFDEKGEKLIFYVKSTTGLCAITFILAGTVRMPFWKFMKFSFLGGLGWSFIRLGIGLFFGYAASQISQYIKYAGIVIFIAAIIMVIIITLVKKWESNKILGNGNGD